MNVDLRDIMTPADAVRFWALVERGPRMRCWRWKGSHKKKGYARFTIKGHTVEAHRVSYFLHHGDLDPHLDVDHLCRTRDCVNPYHGEAVCPDLNRHRRITHYKNTLQGEQHG